ncbi:acyl-CoA dehydrogenase family protein [Rhodococcus olei]|uniref:Acyl-CoA dehydrogenase family protein n=1 Tax=Rhodococcus olei TaxID=2161675 RepID=A0ABP8NZ04_9NOCA
MTAINDFVDQSELQQLTELVEQIATSAGAGEDCASAASLDRAAWDLLTQAGLTELTTDEGGDGAGWPHVAVVLRELGRHAVLVPFVEHVVLASWLLQTAGLPSGGGLRTAVTAVAGQAGTTIPWGRDVDGIVVLEVAGDGATARIAEVPVPSLDLAFDVNVAGEPRDRARVTLDEFDSRPVDPALAEQFLLRGVLARSLMISGAAHRALDLVVEHVTTREQFGRALGKFQAVQHLVADMASESTLVDASTGAAVDALVAHGIGDPRARFAIACAASCTGHAASTIVRNAHQVLGAMGFTHEHTLHRYTNRILSWRSESGAVRQWDERVARAAAQTPRDSMWSLIGDS